MLALAALAPAPARAQVLRSALGLAGGLVAGIHITTGVFVMRSRVFGHDMHTPEDILTLRPETAPLVIMPVAGAIIGFDSSSRLAGAATWGGVGLVGGAAIGAGVGQLIWGTSGGRWAGGTIGSAAGLALGAVLGAALSSQTEPADPGSSLARRRYLTFSLPLGPGR